MEGNPNIDPPEPAEQPGAPKTPTAAQKAKALDQVLASLSTFTVRGAPVDHTNVAEVVSATLARLEARNAECAHLWALLDALRGVSRG